MIFRGADKINGTRSADCERGATLVELAVVLPLTFFLIIALVVGTLGVFRYQEVAALTRAAGRYASTHGAQYRKDANLSRGTAADWQADIQANAVTPVMVLLDANLLTLQASWSDVSNQPGIPDNWPDGIVTVTITYRWFPELLLVGPYVLSSTSSMQISN